MSSADGDNLTHTGDILGTLRYMSPEAFDGTSDARSDVYSLGLTLYELVAPQPAFNEGHRHKLIKQVTTADAPRLDRLNSAIPRDLVTIVHKAIERDPNHRYATAAELAADLQRFIDDEPIQARRLSWRERGWRWARHHPSVAALLGTVAALLVMITMGSVLTAAHFDRLAQRAKKSAEDEYAARKFADGAKEREAKLREQAESNRTKAEANFTKARAAVDDYLTKVSENQLLRVSGM